MDFDTASAKKQIIQKLKEIGGCQLLFVSIFKTKDMELKLLDVLDSDEGIKALEKVIVEVVEVAISGGRDYFWAGDLWESKSFLELHAKNQAYIFGVICEQLPIIVSKLVSEQKQVNEPGVELDIVSLFWREVAELALQEKPPFVTTKDVYVDGDNQG